MARSPDAQPEALTPSLESKLQSFFVLSPLLLVHLDVLHISQSKATMFILSIRPDGENCRHACWCHTFALKMLPEIVTM